MATRSVIKVEDFEVAIYKHWDGCREAMVPWLEAFNKEFTAKRGIDPSYKLAQCLRWAAVNAAKYELDPSLETGWGIIMASEDMGQDYVYTLMNDGTVNFDEGVT